MRCNLVCRARRNSSAKCVWEWRPMRSTPVRCSSTLPAGSNATGRPPTASWWWHRSRARPLNYQWPYRGLSSTKTSAGVTYNRSSSRSSSQEHITPTQPPTARSRSLHRALREWCARPPVRPYPPASARKCGAMITSTVRTDRTNSSASAWSTGRSTWVWLESSYRPAAASWSSSCYVATIRLGATTSRANTNSRARPTAAAPNSHPSPSVCPNRTRSPDRAADMRSTNPILRTGPPKPCASKIGLPVSETDWNNHLIFPSLPFSTLFFFFS